MIKSSRDVEQWIFHCVPIFGINSVHNFKAVFHAVRFSNRGSHKNWNAVLHGKQANTFITAGHLAKEWDKESVVARVLIGDKSNAPAIKNYFLQFLRGVPFGKHAKSASTAHSKQPIVKIWIVKRTRERGEMKVKNRQRESKQFPIAAVASHKDGGLLGQ